MGFTASRYGELYRKEKVRSLKKINLLIDLMNRKLTGGLENLTIGYEQPYMENGSLEYTKEGFLRAH